VPTNPDTDADGLPDGSEVKREALSDANPLQKDIFVEVDYVRGHKPPTAVLERATEMYDAAPVSNPDGTTGINLHASYDEAIQTDGTVYWDQVDESLMPEYFDHEDDGYRYAIAVADAKATGFEFEIGGRQGGSNGEFIFETTYRNSNRQMTTGEIAGIFVHELGHSAGIGGNAYKGVDSTAVSYSTYTSRMNYNSPNDALTYNTGEPFDDWEHIEQGLQWSTPFVALES
jgi:hypothetical protein